MGEYTGNISSHYLYELGRKTKLFELGPIWSYYPLFLDSGCQNPTSRFFP